MLYGPPVAMTPEADAMTNPNLSKITEARILLTTVDDAAIAKQLARQLVEMRLAACVNQIERVHSTYRWEGKIEEADEILLIVKTAAERIPAVKEAIARLHPYQVPEILVLPVEDGSDSYLAWLLEAIREPGSGETEGRDSGPKR